jgi:hypothetical protein
MSGLVRRPDWQPRLIELANQRRRMPYSYGKNDCWLFARAAVETMTGALLFPDMPSYGGWIAAARVMISRGWETIEDMATEMLGPPTDPETSRPGDIVSYEAAGDLHLAVRIGDMAIAPMMHGTQPIAPHDWRRCWKVG